MTEDCKLCKQEDLNEIYKANQNLICQTIQKLSLRCEFCFVLKKQSDNDNDNNDDKSFTYHQEELQIARLVFCKACMAEGENQPQNESYLVLCEPHWSICQQDLLLKFNEVSQIRVEISNPDIETAKSINLSSNNYPNRIIEEKNYCCRRLLWNYIALLKTLYKVEGHDAQKTIENVIQIRELQIIELEQKHNEYLKNKDQMTLKQKFLMLQQLKKQSQYEEYSLHQSFIDDSNIGDFRYQDSEIMKYEFQQNQYY